ncbi:putative two-component system response regulator [Actinoplanes missouriensis 431]|uniref:Putative two-component system response regulator n=1 Tax=Actinoplanes missouriensis (strain ATCC 14538 / DSM 43046 / CBS 188.64 / JCM 3121 / NBRC 102363 / NCIMB 12654 / NRRL B-3342 / UNCC 431) TaxID=512565 RepID=I0H098_ACTM4|nr:response regulator transcription factor [Actinoplanes missouriensis]BAL86435.1 putative two-component system response regulator [Actinoplanes missouriensis 431]
MTGSGALRVLVVDDQQLVREGLTALLELTDGVTVVGSAGDGERAIEMIADHRPDVVLMDLRMPVLDGVAATARARERFPEVAVVVLTTYADDESIAGALAAGARGYLTKDAGRAEIAMALRAAAAGNSLFAPEVSARLAEAMRRPAEVSEADRGRSSDQSGRLPDRLPGRLSDGQPGRLPDGLTRREAEVLGRIGQGRTNAEIAAELFVAEATIKTHINNAFAKIGVRNRAEATRYALRHGLTPG